MAKWITKRMKQGAALGVLIALGCAAPVVAITYTDPNFIINGGMGTSSGASDDSSNYGLMSVSGAGVIGGGSGGSYVLSDDSTPTGTEGEGESSSSMQLSVQPSGLLAYYPLDETSGQTAHDYGPSGYDATSQASETWVTGQVGGAVGPMGGNSNAVFISSNQTDLSTPTLTVCVWDYKTGGASGNPVLVGRAAGVVDTPGMWTIGYGNAQVSRFDLVPPGQTTNTRLNANTKTSYNTWNFLCGRYDGTTMALFVNGVLDAQTTLGGTLPNLVYPLSIGARSNGSSTSTYDTIDDVKLFGRALSDAEIKTLYEAGVDGAPAGLAFSTLVAGAPQQVGFDTRVKTDGSAYALSIAENHNLQLGGSTTIPSVTSTIASPAAWQTGTTKGLGFSIVSAPNLPDKWGGGDNYAAIPTSASTFYSRSGSTPNDLETLAMRLKLDVPADQPIGQYKNTITITATATP